MQTIVEPSEKVFTEHLIEDHVMSNDDAMDAFRSTFPLVSGCNVSADGNVMSFSFAPGQISLAIKMLAEAHTIINYMKLPLASNLEPVKLNGVTLSRTLQIIYAPNKK